MRVLQVVGLTGVLAAAYVAGLVDSGSGATSREHRYRMTSLSWTFSAVAEADITQGAETSCRTRVKLTGRNRGTIVISARTDLTRVPEIPASMTLIVGAPSCDPPAPVSCAGTYRAKGAVIGHFLLLTNGGKKFMTWGHKMVAPEPLPNRSSCGPELGTPIFEFFYAGLYAPRGGGAFRSPNLVPLPTQRLLAGRRFTTRWHRTIPGAWTLAATATFVPMTR